MQIEGSFIIYYTFYVLFSLPLWLELLEMAVPCNPYFTYLFLFFQQYEKEQ
jgi:hypothetical protein